MHKQMISLFFGFVIYSIRKVKHIFQKKKDKITLLYFFLYNIKFSIYISNIFLRPKIYVERSLKYYSLFGKELLTIYEMQSDFFKQK